MEIALCKWTVPFLLPFWSSATLEDLLSYLTLFVGELQPVGSSLSNVHFLSRRLPPLLLGDAAGNLQEGHELEGDAGLPPRGAHLGEIQGYDPEVGLPILPKTTAQLSVLWSHYLGHYFTERMGLYFWQQNNTFSVTRSLLSVDLWTCLSQVLHRCR